MTKPGAPALEKVLWGALILVLVGVVGAGTRSVLRERASARLTLSDKSARPPIHGLVPDFSFSERSGRSVERVDLLGKIWIVNLIYTHCPDTCPLQGAEMAKLQADLLTEPDIRLVSISVDPARDTPEVLSRYARRFGADPKQWLFLTGEREAIYRFAQEGLRLPLMDPRSRGRIAGGDGVAPGSFHSQQAHLFGPPRSARRVGAPVLLSVFRRMLEPSPAMASARKGKVTLLHSSRFVLVDREARIRGYYESTDVESLLRLREHVKALLREE
ncbi:MAG: SCO family protein [Candidatus Methylomirabilis sp.]